MDYVPAMSNGFELCFYAVLKGSRPKLDVLPSIPGLPAGEIWGADPGSTNRLISSPFRITEVKPVTYGVVNTASARPIEVIGSGNIKYLSLKMVRLLKLNLPCVRSPRSDH